MANSDDVLHEFLVESYENLDRLDRELVELEQRPDAAETLSSIFRTIHTIKGTSGFFGFAKLGELTHVGENLLSRMRDGELRCDERIIGALLEMVDAVREMLASIETSHDEGEGDYSALTARLAELGTGAAVPRLGELLIESGQAHPEDVAAALKAQDEGDPRKLGQILVEDRAVPAAVVGEALAAQKQAAVPAPAAAPAHEESGSSAANASIRVDTALLDRLMNLAGELVLARNQMMQLSARVQDQAFTSTCQRLNLITSELQEGVMRTRMQPIGHLLTKLPRVVRDLATACGKQVRVEIEGKETDLDRTVLEAIKDPLTHLIRNSVDHGIETPAARLHAGKPSEGLLRIRAFHEGGQIHIEIADDGAGIDVERVKKKALEKRLITQSDAERMNERELTELIFLPGFSTAEQVTNISGRGVGMDVVRANVQKISGTIDIQSRRGLGTTLRIKIPLTLAIIPALIVSSGGDRYAIPQVSVQELVRIGAAGLGIEDMYGAPVYRLRDSLLPLVHLSRVFGGEPTGGHLVVVQTQGCTFGLVVDEVNDTEEIVVKPLERQMQQVGPYAGATILGDGRVALILDARAIASEARLLVEGRPRPRLALRTSDEETLDAEPLLVARVGAEGRVALPLSQVARLEEFDPARVEKNGMREVVQYRGRILPLVRVGEVLGAYGGDDAPARLHVVVHTAADGNSVGLVVERILDVVRQPLVRQGEPREPGVLGAVVIQERVTELLDLEGLMRSVGVLACS